MVSVVKLDLLFTQVLCTTTCCVVYTGYSSLSCCSSSLTSKVILRYARFPAVKKRLLRTTANINTAAASPLRPHRCHSSHDAAVMSSPQHPRATSMPQQLRRCHHVIITAAVLPPPQQIDGKYTPLTENLWTK